MFLKAIRTIGTIYWNSIPAILEKNSIRPLGRWGVSVTNSNFNVDQHNEAHCGVCGYDLLSVDEKKLIHERTNNLLKKGGKN